MAIIFPVVGGTLPKSSGLGLPRDGGRRKHKGLDIFASRGTHVVSPVSGVVIASGNAGGTAGVLVKVRDASGNVHRFLHLSGTAVSTGTQIRAGQLVGFVGNTGNASTTDPHLHYSINEGGEGALIDPWNFLQDAVPGNGVGAPGGEVTDRNRVHIVKPGETLSEIADRSNMRLETLIQRNPQIEDPDVINPGDVIQITPPGRPDVPTDDDGRVHIVKPGETLSEIASRSDMKLSTLIRRNPQIEDPNVIEPGDVIQITPPKRAEQDTGARSPALPRRAKLVRAGNRYRVVWNLGDGLGWAWYSIGRKHLKDLFGDSAPEVDFRFRNLAQFEKRFGNLHFGNAAEISLKAETPWQDLKQRIFSQFGHVPGIDNKEIRRLLIQGFFEGWSQNEWIVQYRKTNYFNRLTDSQRAWAGLSEAQKKQSVEQTATRMANIYEDLWGRSRNPSSFNRMARRVASGAELLESWEFNQRSAAQRQEGTPAWASRRQEVRAGREEQNLEENMALFAEDEWNNWVGPVSMPNNFGDRWGKWLATGTKSEADLEERLRKVSTARWRNKPDDMTWADWAAAYKSEIRDELELASLDDTDPLLKKVLRSSDVEGQDLTRMIRQDNRFLSTQTMYNELSSAVADMGRRFGFIT